MVCNLCAIYVHLQWLTSIWLVLLWASLCITIGVKSVNHLRLMGLFDIGIRRGACLEYFENEEKYLVVEQGF